MTVSYCYEYDIQTRDGVMTGERVGSSPYDSSNVILTVHDYLIRLKEA